MSPDRFYLTQTSVSTLISALKEGRDFVTLSPDLNLSQCRVELADSQLSLCGLTFTLDELQTIFKGTSASIFLLERGTMKKLEISADKFYKLYPTVNAPSLEINGVRMHRTQQIDPWEDSRRKVAHIVRKGDKTLDTCSGLGYTAVWAMKMGARQVISIEKDANVIELRKLNPHSAQINDPRIETIPGDAAELIVDFQPEEFDSIIHDPPRFALGGELYSFDFYTQLYRVLKPGGRMLHYVGNPYSKGRGRKFIQGILRRLKEAGFHTKRLPNDLSILCWKSPENISRSVS